MAELRQIPGTAPAPAPAPSPGQPADFMAGVHLLDEMLREAERLGYGTEEEGRSFWLAAKPRKGLPLSLYLLPLVQRLQAQPQLAAGFAAALGDYIGTLQVGLAPSSGDQYTHLSFRDIVGPPHRVAAPSSGGLKGGFA